MLLGALPPAVVQDSRYHVSHRRGLIFQSVSVAKMENIIVARRPAHLLPSRSSSCDRPPDCGSDAHRSCCPAECCGSSRNTVSPDQCSFKLVNTLRQGSRSFGSASSPSRCWHMVAIC